VNGISDNDPGRESEYFAALARHPLTSSERHGKPLPGTTDRPDSPFEFVRHTTREGREFWSARDLMPLLGYDSWRRFADAIDRARISAKNSGHDITRLFAGAVKNTAGRPAEDVHLSRLACYLIAMNGDPRKPEVAAAQTYFAVRTREAEIAEPRPAIPQTYAEALRAAADQSERADAAEARAAELEPSATAWDRLHDLGGDVDVADAAKILSRDPNIEIGRNRLFEFMHDQDWVFRGRHNTWKAYQDQVDLDRLKMRPGGEYHHKPTGETRIGDPTILITAKGLAELRRLLGGKTGLLELVVS
jgi:phage antirepressor YoqD-like protein